MANKDSVLKYQKSRDNIMIRPTRIEGLEIRKAAADAGQSVQAYILQAIRERLQREDPSGERKAQILTNQEAIENSEPSFTIDVTPYL